jgi:hypothetical protein
MTIYSKVCTQCKISKPHTEFCINKSSKDGYNYCCKSCQKNYYINNKKLILEKCKEYNVLNKESRNEYRTQWNIKNPNYNKNYYQTNRDNIRKLQNEYERNRTKVDHLFKLRKRIRSLIRRVISNNGFHKKSKTYDILGCSNEEFKIHIESQFTEGMSWDNHGDWHLDHITPVSWGNTEEEIIALNHYTNFQPLWAMDNFKKGNRYSN